MYVDFIVKNPKFVLLSYIIRHKIQMQPVIIVLHLPRLVLTNRPKMKLKILDRIQYLQKCNGFFRHLHSCLYR